MGQDVIVVLQVESRVPVAEQTVVRCVLLHRVDLTDDEVRQGIPGRTRKADGTESEASEILEIAVKDVLLEGELTAKVDAVFALGDTDQIAEGVRVRVRNRAGERAAATKVAGDGDRWKSLGSLCSVVRAELLK